MMNSCAILVMEGFWMPQCCLVGKSARNFVAFEKLLNLKETLVSESNKEILSVSSSNYPYHTARPLVDCSPRQQSQCLRKHHLGQIQITVDTDTGGVHEPPIARPHRGILAPEGTVLAPLPRQKQTSFPL